MRRKLKKLCLACLILAVLGAGWFCLRPASRAQIAVRVVGRTNDPTGRLQIIYEITNRTAKDLAFGLASVEARTGTVWHIETRRQWGEQRELGAIGMLGRRTACAVRIIASDADGAVRGLVEYEKPEASLVAKIRWLARRAGLPHHFWAPRRSIFGEVPVGSIRLPEVATAGEPFLLATTADGVWPDPSIETRHNGYMRAKPAGIIEMYRALSGAIVNVDPSVSLYGASVTVDPAHDIGDPAELLRLMEDALRQQAGVVVTERGSNSVTFAWDERAMVKNRQ